MVLKSKNLIAHQNGIICKQRTKAQIESKQQLFFPKPIILKEADRFYIIGGQVAEMGPKKQAKKEVIEQPPKQKQPEIPLHELQGYGRFEYLGGACYQGNWKLFRGIKMKHGHGTLTVQSPNGPAGRESYQGNWEEDKMQGVGTYIYPDGSVYKGDWKNNQHHGVGVYEFPNGTVYEGEWQHQLMHGTGYFIDHTGRKWGRQFRRGVFQSRGQGELVKEKAIVLRKNEIKKELDATLSNLIDAIAKSDKKTMKDNVAPFFANADNPKEFVKEPYAKFEERPPEKWTEFLTLAKSGTYKILSNASEATIITSDRILRKQLQGIGQIVQITSNREDKTVRAVLVGLQAKRWIVVLSAQEQKKK